MIHKKQGEYSSRIKKLKLRSSDGDSDRTSSSTSRSGSTSDTESGQYHRSESIDSVIDLSPRVREADTESTAVAAEHVVSMIEKTGEQAGVTSTAGTQGLKSAIALGSLFSFGGGVMIGLPFTMLLLKDTGAQAAAIFSSGVIGFGVGGVVMSAMYQWSSNSSASAQSPA